MIANVFNIDDTVLDFRYVSANNGRFIISHGDPDNPTSTIIASGSPPTSLLRSNELSVSTLAGTTARLTLTPSGGLPTIAKFLEDNSISGSDLVDYFKNSQFLEFLTIYLNYLINAASIQPNFTLTYDSDSDSMVLTAVDNDVQHIQLTLGYCEWVKNEGTIADGVTKTDTALIFEKSK